MHCILNENHCYTAATHSIECAFPAAAIAATATATAAAAAAAIA
jgi:hypothetical protein